jgi:tetratricopeptide (TPR) repeat protein
MRASRVRTRSDFGYAPPRESEPVCVTDPIAARSISRRRIVLGGVAVAVLVVGAVVVVARPFGARRPGGSDSTAATGSAAAFDPAADEVSAGIHATDPNLAVIHFQRALALVPDHYGASFQLARALDRAGRKDEAQAVWARVLRMAERYDDRSVIDTARARLADPMTLGLDALYTKHDPAAAAARFREVLAKNPQHYGATFQLAIALDQAEKPAESRPVWAKMLTMAEAINDTATADRARARLAAIDRLPVASASPDPDAESMRLGLEALHTKHDPAGAAVLFRKVLAHNPEHYGATFQLATALDQESRPAEARPFWTKVLKLADAVNDTTVAAIAHERLAKIP